MHDHPVLFEMPESEWVRRRCRVCGCAISVEYRFTYLVQRQGWVKIGATNKPVRRINELARPAWIKHILFPPGMDWNEPLIPLAIWSGDSEHVKHDWFRKSHIIGEWFLPDAYMRAWLRAVLS